MTALADRGHVGAPRRGHPPGLPVLFFTEMWERFSFYGLRALLVLYMIKHLGFSQPQASNIYGLYTAAAYFTPLLGGWLADRVLGQKRAVLLGALAMAAGHFLMTFEPAFFPALALVALGNGAFKPVVSTQVGQLYDADDPRRDRGYSIFYLGINLGSCVAPLICGALAAAYGWRWGFAIAGVGMLVATLVFFAGGSKLVFRQASPSRSAWASAEANEGRAIRALLLVALVAVFFWTAYEQVGNTLALWVDGSLDRRIAINHDIFTVPTVWFQSLNPFLIIALTPVLNLIWASRQNGAAPETLSRMITGCVFLGLAFAPLAFAAAAGLRGLGGLTLTLVFFLGQTIGELHLSPMGQALFSRRAPARFGSMMMGVWFCAHTVGNYLSGFIGMFWSQIPHMLFFLLVGSIPVACALGLVALRRQMRGWLA